MKDFLKSILSPVETSQRKQSHLRQPEVQYWCYLGNKDEMYSHKIPVTDLEDAYVFIARYYQLTPSVKLTSRSDILVFESKNAVVSLNTLPRMPGANDLADWQLSPEDYFNEWLLQHIEDCATCPSNPDDFLYWAADLYAVEADLLAMAAIMDVNMLSYRAVSYTHLTLPTKRIV